METKELRSEIDRKLEEATETELRLFLAFLESQHNKEQKTEDLRKLILEAPTWSDEQLEQFKKARALFNTLQDDERLLKRFAE